MTEHLHPCCDPSTPSAIWEGTPSGEVIEISGIETYIAKPPALKGSSPTLKVDKVILFLTEGHGIYLPNAQLLADSFASHLNCDIIMPDEFAGQARLPKNIEPSLYPHKVIPWTEDKNDPNYDLRGLAVPHEPEVTDPILEKIVSWIHESYGQGVKIGGVGYCFGGRYVMRLMGAGVIDVGVVNHPSFFNMDEVGKLGRGKRLAIFAAERDDILPAEERRGTEDVLTRTGVTWTSTVFSGTEHGFSVRGDLSIKEMRLAKEYAFRGAVQWFSDWL
ncbi:uncharacterized protein LY89DRAFT_602432 [Mollisia scopiformis]|uniref:Dienelactone hydrolase domain-containing protein n=1 Tax=Mollisia scopiformis TaxID=149040 RepID=A0A132B330_MOLSC|nr:uncharacterized protein LY89DRAFT_602432 [Mollisia scopiformis]KUJ06802.1 hypothetical protein LY89DRAFT_602432 [Mollisia scopiformis]